MIQSSEQYPWQDLCWLFHSGEWPCRSWWPFIRSDKCHVIVETWHEIYNKILMFKKLWIAGEIPKNQDILREAYSLCFRLPVLNTDKFKEDFYNVCTSSFMLLLMVMLSFSRCLKVPHSLFVSLKLLYGHPVICKPIHEQSMNHVARC